MKLIITDIYIINNILSYVNNNKKILINRYYYNKCILELKKQVSIIERFYIKNKLRLQMIFEYLEYENIQAIRNYYILFYPKEFRATFVLHANMNARRRLLTYNDKEDLIKCINICETSNQPFIDLIKYLSLNELALLGW